MIPAHSSSVSRLMLREDGRRIPRTIALLHWFRRLRIRWEIRDDIHEPS
ncbi:hypothetical protein [Nonomuraea insulae]|uniref:Uncharacterized protein n=1 Tax=Nonomuraea insulae TaxID=1616787 RepID=A0ABW1CSU0_9ACTN